MNKKYRYAKVGLLIGLLSFHTFSSCVSPGQALGANPSSNSARNMEHGIVHLTINSPSASTTWLENLAICFSGAAFIIGTTLGPLWLFNLATGYLGHPSNVPKLSKRNETIHAPVMPADWHTSTTFHTSTNAALHNLTATEGTFIINAITKNPEDLVHNGTPSEWVTDKEDSDDVKDLNAMQQKSKSIKFIEKRSPSWSKAPSGKAKNSMVIDDSIIETLKDKNLQELAGENRWTRNNQYWLKRNSHWLKAVKYWLEQGGLNIDATDSMGYTLLIKAVEMENKPAVEFLLRDKRADVNKTNEEGESAIFFAVRVLLDKIIHGSWSIQDDILDLLMQYKPDLCIKNNKGQGIQDMAESIYRKKGYLSLIKQVIENLSQAQKCAAA